MLTSATTKSDSLVAEDSPSVSTLEDRYNERYQAGGIHTQLDEVESIPDSSNLAGTLTDDDAPSVLLEETSTLGGEEKSGNPFDFFELPSGGNPDSKIANLSLEEARSAIPESVLKTLKKQFNGSLEHCRPINQSDQFF